MSVKHAFVSAKPQSSDATLASKSEWNADHVIDPATITYAQIQNVSATDKVLGRQTAGAGPLEEIPCTAAGRALLAGASAGAQKTTLGLAAVASSGSSADLSGLAAIATSGSGADLGAATVSYAKVQNVTTARFLGRNTAGAGVMEELTAATAKTMLAMAAGDLNFAATQRVLGRNTAGAGTGEEVTASQIFDWIANTNGVLLTRTAGTWGTVANVTTDNGDIVIANNASPVAPSAGSKLFSQSLGGRTMPAFFAAVGDKSFLQPLIARKHVMQMIAVPASTETRIGFVPSLVGTSSGQTPASTNFYTACARSAYLSSGAGTGVAGIRNAVGPRFWLGNGAGLGGYFVCWRFAISDAALVATGRTFVGIGSAAAPTDVDPSTLTNQIGIGNNNGDAHLQLYASGAVAQARVDLGANFPANTTKTDVYELILFAQPNATVVTYQVTRLNTGDVVTGTISAGANLPSSTTLLTQTIWRSEGGTASPVKIDILSYYSETDN